VSGAANLPWTLVLAYEPSATVSARSYPLTGYGALGGASLKYDPLLYGFRPQVILGNAAFRLNVHVRVLRGNETLIPDFDVPYRVNGTSRVARRGEDALEWTFSWIELPVRDPLAPARALALEFPREAGGCALLNSSTVYADPRVQADVWIYYACGEAPSPAQPPGQPGQQPGGEPPGQPGQQPGGGAAAAPSESPVVRAISEGLPVPPNLLLLLLGLLLIALGLYLRWRSKRFVLVVEVKG
jgi:hypothetical protein